MVLDLSYVSGSREDASKVLEAVIEAYKKFLKDNYQRNTNEVVDLIKQARDVLHKDLKELEREYRELREKAPNFAVDADGRSSIARRIEKWDELVHNAQLREQQLVMQLNLSRQLSEQGASAETIQAALEQIAGISASLKGAPGLDPAGRPDATLGQDPRGEGQSFESLLKQLTDVEGRRKAAERQLELLHGGMAEAQGARGMDQATLNRMLEADPE